MEIILATNNQGKLNELRTMIDMPVKSLNDIGFHEDIDEFGKTLEQNALIKAQEIAKLFPSAIVISDDSGLEVKALDDAPGVYSKRFSNSETNIDYNNNIYLLKQMEHVTDRRAQFRTVLCVCSVKYQLCNFYSGIVEGEIGNELEGENGFGYDPLFLYMGTSFANLSIDAKNDVSHRARALRKLVESGVLNV